VVINRSDGYDTKTFEFSAQHELPVLMTIPFDRKIAAIQNRGDLICRSEPIWQERFTDLFARCLALGGVRT